MKVLTKDYLLNQFKNYDSKVVDVKIKAVSDNLQSVSDSLATVATSGSYNDLSNVPTKVSDFNNDSEFQTLTQVNNAINSAVTSAYIFKGSVDTEADLPESDTEGLKVGHVYNVIDTNMNFAWTGEAWDPLGSTFDPSELNTSISGLDGRVTQNETDIGNLQTAVGNITEEDSDIDFTNWNEPSGGEPSGEPSNE